MGTWTTDRFDAVIGGFVKRLCAAASPRGRRRVLALDGKDPARSRCGDSPAGTYSG